MSAQRTGEILAGIAPKAALSGRDYPVLGAAEKQARRSTDQRSDTDNRKHGGTDVANTARGKGGKGASGKESSNRKLGDGSGNSGPEADRAQFMPIRARDVAEPAIMQREHERERIVVDGKRTDDNSRCSLIVIHEIGGTWVFYPHGDRKLGVRLAKAEAGNMAQVIADSVQ